jgi:hypothetical protein
MRFFFFGSIVLLFFLIPKVHFGQSFNAFKKAGDEAYKLTDYNAAMHYYSRALAKKPDEPSVCFQYAMVAKAFFAFDIAEKYFLETLKLDEENLFGKAEYHLAHVYKQKGEYEKAIEFFDKFLKGNKDSGLTSLVNTHIASCENAQSLVETPSSTEVKRLGKGINTAYSEFGALKQGDTLFYSSYRFDNKKDKTLPSRKISKKLISVRNGRGRVMRKFNSEEANTAHVAFSLNGKRIYYNICTYGKGLDIKCRLFYKEKDKRGRWKKTGVALPDTINLKGYTTTQPSIGFDSLENKEVLFFASDRPGGEGGLDIWKVYLEKEKNKYGRPMPVSKVNTKFNEITPFYVTSSQTLYLSSDKPESMGGYDVFYLKHSIRKPVLEHLNPPVNSSYNDIYYTLNTDGLTGYLSSNRPGSLFLDRSNKACCNDIYAFKPKPAEIPQDTFIINDEEVALEKDIPIEEKEPTTLEDFLPLALYFDNDEPDKRTRRQTTRKNYDDTFQKFYGKKDLFKSGFSDPLKEDQQDEGVLLVEDFFEEEVGKGHRHLFLFSEILLKRLEMGEQVEIFIKGFTSPRAKSDYNLSLGKRRVSCLKNHFFEYKNSIFTQYIDSEQLIITERSFGETSSSANVSDALEDLRNSIYSPAASRERRVEIVEIKVGEE